MHYIEVGITSPGTTPAWVIGEASAAVGRPEEEPRASLIDIRDGYASSAVRPNDDHPVSYTVFYHPDGRPLRFDREPDPTLYVSVVFVVADNIDAIYTAAGYLTARLTTADITYLWRAGTRDHDGQWSTEPLSRGR